MKQEFIIKEGRERLTILFAGWGMDMNVFRDYGCDGSDLLLCYNYTDGSFDSSILGHYREIDVVAWSLGVWAAQECLSGLRDSIRQATAINGTPRPVDDSYGIPEAIYRGTLETLSDASLVKFRRRMCGNAAGYSFFMERCPERGIEDLKAELEAIALRSSGTAFDGKFWDRAIAGTGDRIFPFTSQKAMWETAAVPLTVADIAHYNDNIMRETVNGND